MFDALAGKQGTLTFDSAPTSGSANPVTSGGVFTALSGKQNTLTFDTSPKSGSTKPVTSGGVYTALSGKQATLTFDTTPTQNSDNPVKSGGVYTALAAKAALASPTFTGTPKAPTAAAGTNTTQIATTAFVQTAVGVTKDFSNNVTYDLATKTAARFVKHGTMVTVEFNGTITSVTNANPLFTLPSGYRPKVTTLAPGIMHLTSAATSSEPDVIAVELNTNGKVTLKRSGRMANTSQYTVILNLCYSTT